MFKQGGTGTFGAGGSRPYTTKGGTAANAMNSRSSLWPTVANAHAVFASCCEWKSLMRCSAAAANAMNSRSSLWPTRKNVITAGAIISVVHILVLFWDVCS